MVTDFPIQGILDHLVRRMVDILPVSAAGVTLISPSIQPRYVAASNGAALRFEKLQTELGQGPCVAAYETGEAVTVADLRTEDRFPEFTAQAQQAGMAAVFTFPLRQSGSKPLGALDLYRDKPGKLSADSMHAAQTLANVAAAYLVNAQARSELQASSDRAREAALHDALTGLPNRILLLERIAHTSVLEGRSKRTSALLFIDLDRFKDINDTYGHQAGDEALVAMSKRLPNVLRPGDTLARLSGDEFAVLCEGLHDASEAEPIIARVQAAFEEPFKFGKTELHIGASIGVAFTGGRERTPEELLRDADVEMYKAKRQRGERPHSFDLRELHRADGPVDLEQDLRDAMDTGTQLYLEYQPIVTAADGRVTGTEALLRWSHPSHGMIPPAVLIPLAERSGLIVDVGRWVLEQARADQGEWRADAGSLQLAVNVSAHQLMSVGFAESVATAIAGRPGEPHLLTLEMTESVFVRDPERALTVLNDIKDMGVRLALDDFGTGYSSLSYLKRYPVDCLKIDQEFVSDLGTLDSSTTIIAAVVGLAHGLGMSVVGEGVETAKQHGHLTELGCDSCQGFYFARPMSSSRLDTVLGENGSGTSHLPAAN
jgi:diguanylate cyclase (GGDEF)-like protein